MSIILHIIMDWSWRGSRPGYCHVTEVAYCGKDVNQSEKTIYVDRAFERERNVAICIDCLFVHKESLGLRVSKPRDFDLRTERYTCAALTEEKSLVTFRGFLRICKRDGEDSPPRLHPHYARFSPSPEP